MRLRPKRVIGLILGIALIVWLLRQLPPDVFASTLGFLVVAAVAFALFAAAATFFVPARRALEHFFEGLPEEDARKFALISREEARTLVRPLVVSTTCLVVAGVALVARGF